MNSRFEGIYTWSSTLLFLIFGPIGPFNLSNSSGYWQERKGQTDPAVKSSSPSAARGKAQKKGKGIALRARKQKERGPVRDRKAIAEARPNREKGLRPPKDQSVGAHSIGREGERSGSMREGCLEKG